MTSREICPRAFQLAKPIVLNLAEKTKSLRPLQLYRGNLSLHRIRQLLGFLLVAKELEVVPETSAYTRLMEFSAGEPELRHLLGNHSKCFYRGGLVAFSSRLLNTPEVTSLFVGLREYVEELCAHDRIWLPRLTRIDEVSKWTRQAWRKPFKVCSECGKEHRSRGWKYCNRCKAKPKPQLAPVSEYYPFIINGRAAPEILTLVHDAVPKTLPEQIRPDICQDLVVSLLARELKPSDLKGAVPEFIKENWRKLTPKWGFVSLSENRFDGRPWSDFI
jgi:hypothetical protein